jgi:Coenzyme PQQ synthesis protein D (PqqD)
MHEKYVTRSKHIASRLLNGEMMIMSASDSTLFNLNVVAALIWQAADGRTPLSEIVRDRICKEFDVPIEIAYRDAEEFVKELESHGILMVLDRPVADPGFGAGAKS